MSAVRARRSRARSRLAAASFALLHSRRPTCRHRTRAAPIPGRRAISAARPAVGCPSESGGPRTPMSADTLQLIILPAGVIAVLFALYLARDILARDTGTKEMQD